jgi:hypothetical protein
MPLKTGDRVPPGLRVVDAERREVPLAGFDGEATLLIFLRHLG